VPSANSSITKRDRPERQRRLRIHRAAWLSLAGMCFAMWLYAVQAKASSLGTDLIVMLDMSMGETERGPIVRTLGAGARVAAMELRPGDRVSLVAFSRDARTLLPMTGDGSQFESALRKSGGWIVERNQRHLYDSLLTALSVFSGAGASDRRRCIVVFTTASDEGSRHTASEVASAARSQNAAIFVALISPQPSRPYLMPGGRVYSNGPYVNEDDLKRILEPLVRETGGDVRTYMETQYVIAKAIGDMVNQ
jgi:uncharacterized protein (DUF58 family)